MVLKVSARRHGVDFKAHVFVVRPPAEIDAGKWQAHQARKRDAPTGYFGRQLNGCQYGLTPLLAGITIVRPRTHDFCSKRPVSRYVYPYIDTGTNSWNRTGISFNSPTLSAGCSSSSRTTDRIPLADLYTTRPCRFQKACASSPSLVTSVSGTRKPDSPIS